MDKHLHEKISLKSTSNIPSALQVTVEQARMDEEFSNELLALKAMKLEPRKEAVEKLFELIAQQSVAQHH